MSDELSAALRELAAAEARPPVVGGPATRARAIRRRRRRRTAVTLGAGTAALALLGVALTLHLDSDPDHGAAHRAPAMTQPRSAPPSTAAPVPVSGTLDLAGHTLTLGGRVLPVLTDFDVPAGTTSPMTAVAKNVRRSLTVDVRAKGPVTVDVRYAVELRDDEGRPLYVGAFTPELKLLSQYDVSGRVIGLGTEDAKWFYDRIGRSDAISLTTATTPITATPTVTPSSATPSAAERPR
ncbi:hypothetical protein GCM10022403_035850 [Streptomyces coacervatus]|uniref:Uncharacterized protein n=1 Tax=Streptomyces coacervatus TaxID=647381 RepID=A0ABP7HUP3_9ACTN|nr:hypothetical protein [Streptomyces coacervatus]MDF2270986.1 hypothetical protein [Streptomyces coacervatus]